MKSRDEANTLIPDAVGSLDGDGYFWVAYPKKSSKKYTCDINCDTGWDVLAKRDLEGVTQISIDEDWSAIRFRRVDFIKTLKRKKAMSEKGKARIKNNK